jgi:hypothetical protein
VSAVPDTLADRVANALHPYAMNTLKIPSYADAVILLDTLTEAAFQKLFKDKPRETAGLFTTPWRRDTKERRFTCRIGHFSGCWSKGNKADRCGEVSIGDDAIRTLIELDTDDKKVAFLVDRIVNTAAGMCKLARKRPKGQRKHRSGSCSRSGPIQGQ